MGADGTNVIGYIQAVGSSAFKPLVLQGRGGSVGIGKTNPTETLHVSGNLKGSVGTICHTFLAQWTSTDLSLNQTLVLVEPGNASGYKAWFHGGINGNLFDGSSDGISWNWIRLVIRGYGDNNAVLTGTLRTFTYFYAGNTYNANFNIGDAYGRGYYTWISPWFQLATTDVPGIGIQVTSLNTATVRIGPVYVQVKN